MKALSLKTLPSTNTLSARFKVTMQGQKAFIINTDAGIFNFNSGAKPLVEQCLEYAFHHVFGFHEDVSQLVHGQLDSGLHVATITPRINNNAYFYTVDFCGSTATDRIYIYGEQYQVDKWCAHYAHQWGYFHHIIITKAVECNRPDFKIVVL